jgi:alpha-beta hydrolase superfamily lysophospholipase
MTDVIRADLRLPVRPVGGADMHIAVRIVGPGPDRLAPQPVILFCFPGGRMTKVYFDLDAEGDRSFSFAEAMAQRGIVTVSLDHLGVGGSSRPEDGYLLHPEVVADADAEAIAAVKEMFRRGAFGYPPLRDFSAVGVGHSMGGMLACWAQDRQKPFDAVAILGSGPYGLYEHLPQSLRPLADRPQAAREELEARLRAMGTAPLPAPPVQRQAQTFFLGGDRRGVAAMAEARTELINMCGMFVMIPGSWAPEAARLQIPVLLVYGDQDICQDPASTPKFFTRAAAISLAVLPNTGHSHFVFPSRDQLFEMVGDWALRRGQDRTG